MNGPRGLTPPWLVRHDLLSAQECRDLLGLALASEGRFKPAAVDKGLVDPAIRRSSTLRDLGSFESLFERRVRAAVPDFIRELRLTSFDAGEIELELAAHNDGAHFALHGDLYTGGSSARGDRLLSAGYYFHRAPKAFSGGCLRMHRIGAVQGDLGEDIAPEHNSLVVFPSWAPHEVLPVRCPSRAFADSRFAVNCWVYRAGSRAASADGD